MDRLASDNDTERTNTNLGRCQGSSESASSTISWIKAGEPRQSRAEPVGTGRDRSVKVGIGQAQAASQALVGDHSVPGQRRIRGEPACRPGSVRPLARGGGHPSRTAVADSLVRSTREHRAGRPRSLAQGTAGSPLDLAPGGVYRAAAVTCGAGGLLHRRFTLTPRPGRGAVCFLWHCPAGHPGSALPTALPCGARTFLTGPAPGATARPTHPCSGYAERRRPGVADGSGARE